MAQLTFYNSDYLVVRFCAWLLLAGVCLVDYARFRNKAKAQGWQIFALVGAVLGAYIAQGVFALAWILPGKDDANAYRGLILFYSLADSCFLALLLVISTGWCITRRNIKNKCGVFGFPIVNFVSSLIAENILFAVDGHRRHPNEPTVVEDDSLRRVLLVTAFLSILTFVYAWYWVFLSFSEEMKGLRDKIKAKGQTAAAAQQADNSTFVIDDDGDEADEAGGQGAGGGTAAAPAEAQEAEFDIDENEALPDRAKLRLLGRFAFLVQVYILGILVVAIVEGFVNQTSHALDVAVDLMRFVVVAGLAYTFRLRPHNPYYLLEDFDAFDESERPSAGSSSAAGSTAIRLDEWSSVRQPAWESPAMLPSGGARKDDAAAGNAGTADLDASHLFSTLDASHDGDEVDAEGFACTPPPGPTPARARLVPSASPDP